VSQPNACSCSYWARSYDAEFIRSRLLTATNKCWTRPPAGGRRAEMRVSVGTGNLAPPDPRGCAL
jgi:hypothetical protein